MGTAMPPVNMNNAGGDMSMMYRRMVNGMGAPYGAMIMGGFNSTGMRLRMGPVSMTGLAPVWVAWSQLAAAWEAVRVRAWESRRIWARWEASGVVITNRGQHAFLV